MGDCGKVSIKEGKAEGEAPPPPSRIGEKMGKIAGLPNVKRITHDGEIDKRPGVRAPVVPNKRPGLPTIPAKK